MLSDKCVRELEAVPIAAFGHKVEPLSMSTANACILERSPNYCAHGIQRRNSVSGQRVGRDRVGIGIGTRWRGTIMSWPSVSAASCDTRLTRASAHSGT